MKPSVIFIGGASLGVIITVLIVTFMQTPKSTESIAAPADPNAPLYWVAPMDPNFKRDKPGKSPMGMDLVPVYQSADEQAPGTVSIDANVMNNLGVRTAQARKRALHVPIRTVGYVQYNEDTLVHIHPRVEGWVDRLHVKAAGEYVKKGESLYALYSPQLVNAQEEYLLAVKRSNTTLIEAAESRLTALQMPDTAIKQLARTSKVQQSVVFTSPQTGFIDNLNIREGFYVKPGTTLMSIGALDQVWVEAEVFERQTSLVKVGLPVTMTLDYLPGQQWQGKVDYVYPTLDNQTRTLKVRLRFENSLYLLKPNMFAQVTIHANLPDENLLVPTESVIRTGIQDRVVLALGEGKFKSVAVEIGNVVGDYTVIQSGINQDDTVVTSAQFLLDSESSINSDFKRMGSTSEQANNMQMSDTSIPTATVIGLINTVNESSRTVNISREAIDKWGRGPATMDFEVDTSVDIEQFSAQQQIRFTFEIRDQQFVIVHIEPIKALSTTTHQGHVMKSEHP